MLEIKNFSSRTQVQKWLRNVAGITLVAISCSSGVAKLNSQFNPLDLVRIASVNEHFSWPKGKYLVEYVRHPKQDNDDEPENFRTIIAQGYSATTKHENTEIGNLDALKDSIEKEDYFWLGDVNKGIASVIIKQPTDPIALDELINRLKASRALFSIENGSGDMELNYFNGKKLH